MTEVDCPSAEVEESVLSEAPETGTVCAIAMGVSRISRNVPRLETPLVTPAIAEVPALVILPMAKGLLAVGRTRTFCQVSLQVAPELPVLTVKVS